MWVDRLQETFHVSIISLLLKQPNIDLIIYKLLQEDRYYKIAEEDLAAIADGRFAIKKEPPVD